MPTETPALSAIQSLAPTYRRLLTANLDFVLDRYDPDYGFIDTKLDSFTGTNPPANDSRRGRDTVYGWIQSRGIEALCGHADWIRAGGDVSSTHSGRSPADYLSAIHTIVRQVTDRLETIRKHNGGAMFFWFDRQGIPFKVSPDGERRSFQLPPGTVHGSDQFHVRALPAAGQLLEDATLLETAVPYFDRWLEALATHQIVSDQQPFDPRNPVAPVPGRFGHGARMITIGAFSIYLSIYREQRYRDEGLDTIAHILDGHVNLNGRFPDLEALAFVEFVDAKGRPFIHDGVILCDPGHALEFVGLALKFINLAAHHGALSPEQERRITAWRTLLPRLLVQTYIRGRNPIGGIYKSIDLRTGRPYNSDMPWWNMPETLRAAMLAYRATDEPAVKEACLDILRETSHTFLTRYVRPELHMLAYQTLDAAGKPIRTIPATPDLDPGYHTGLSILDFLDALP